MDDSKKQSEKDVYDDLLKKQSAKEYYWMSKAGENTAKDIYDDLREIIQSYAGQKEKDTLDFLFSEFGTALYDAGYAKALSDVIGGRRSLDM